jgi:hypothetical protein
VTDQFGNPRRGYFFSGFSYGDVRHQIKFNTSYSFKNLTFGPNFSYRSGEVRMATFSVVDPNVGYVARAPIGTRPGRDSVVRPNDLSQISEFRTPDMFTIDARAQYDLHDLLGHHLYLIADTFNLLNLAQAASINTTESTTVPLGVATARQSPLRVQLGLRFVY